MTVDRALARADARLGHYECDDAFYSCPQHDDYCGNEPNGSCWCGLDELHVLAAEVRRLQAAYAEERQEHKATLDGAALMRERHAKAVEKAFREALEYAEGIIGKEDADHAWLVSEARKEVERE